MHCAGWGSSLDAFGGKQPGNCPGAPGEFCFPKATLNSSCSRARNDCPTASNRAEQASVWTSGSEIARASLESRACCGGSANASYAAPDA